MSVAKLAPVVCTQVAVCNALGDNRQDVFERLHAGQSGLAAPRMSLPFETLVGQLPADCPTLPQHLRAYDSRLARMALLLAVQVQPRVQAALSRWGKHRVAIVLGTSTGGLLETEAAHEAALKHQPLPPGYSIERTHSLGATADMLAALLEVEGPTYVVSTACSSSAKALASGHRLIHAGVVDAVIAGGLDSLCQLTLRGFHTLGILSPTRCRPFGRDRNGINIGEGGALLLLERDGHGDVALLGSGETSDAYHMSAPDPQGLGAEAAMRAALMQANQPADQVGYINSHGTGTAFNDAAEAKAIARVFGTAPAVASTKAYTGHMLGAAGATEAAFCVATLEQRMVPVSLGSFPSEEGLGIRLCESPEPLQAPLVLSNSFAFGGSNISLLFGPHHG